MPDSDVTGVVCLRTLVIMSVTFVQFSPEPSSRVVSAGVASLTPEVYYGPFGSSGTELRLATTRFNERRFGLAASEPVRGGDVHQDIVRPGARLRLHIPAQATSRWCSTQTPVAARA